MNFFRQVPEFFRSVFAYRAGFGPDWVRRFWGTAVLWSWGLHLLRLGSVVAVAPLLTRLPGADFGFYYLLMSIVAVTPLIDFGFAASVERGVSYGMAGAKKLTSRGLPEGATDGAPNFPLLWKLVHTARAFYQAITIVLVLALGGVGTLIVAGAAPETSQPALAWAAWAVAFVNAAFEVYSSWWNVVLRGLNQVVAGSRILFLGQAVKLALSCALLLLGAGVLSIFAAGLVSSALIRTLSRRSVLRVLPRGERPVTPRAELWELLKLLWPNSWRVGLQLISIYITTLVVMLICKERFSLSGAGEYGFSLNIATVIQGMASVWVAVKWPTIGQLRSRKDLPGMRRLLWSRIWLETVTFILLAIAALICTPLLLKYGGIHKDVLPSPWFMVLLFNCFLETQMIVWGTFLSTENRVPTLWPMVVTNLCTIGSIYLLLDRTGIGLGVFALAPLITGSLFNYWFWPRAGARNLGCSWFRYMFFPGSPAGRRTEKPLATTV